ncbi:hypothetical protein HK102_008914 [Quaeritorhiza haematococci]|nr:hypothetical protein HK102_008914 [Quaeritorhiza haematococci]
MASYEANPEDYKQYVTLSKDRYTRNLVDDGNGKFNLMILCWNTDQKSAIHDHAGAHCLLKVLEGNLTETLYDWPASTPCTPSTSPMEVTAESVHGANTVTYMHDKLGLHRVANTSQAAPAISLHLYTPPFDYCKTFNETTGDCQQSAKCTFDTERGRPVRPVRCPASGNQLA